MHAKTISWSKSVACLVLAASIPIALALALPEMASATTHVIADISVSTTWTPEGSPYILDATSPTWTITLVRVGSDARLTIMPGTRIRPSGSSAAIRVSGALVAVGTSSPVGFDHVGISQDDSGPRVIYLEHARFRSVCPNLSQTGTRMTKSTIIGPSGGSQLFQAAYPEISGNVWVGMALFPQAGTVLRDNVFYKTDVAPVSALVVNDNNFISSRLMQPLSGSTPIDATDNWWETTDTSTVLTHIVGDESLVLYSPFLLEPSPTAPSFESVPPVSWLDGVPSDWVTHDVTLTLNATDNPGGSGLYDSYLTTVGATYPEPNITETVVTAEGCTPVQFWSENLDGNREWPPHAAYVKIDKTAPITASDAATSYVGPALISLTRSDSVSGVARSEWSLDASDWTSGTVVSVSGPGSHTLQFRSTDVAGNVEDTRSVEFDVLIPSQVVVSSTSATSLGYGSEFAVAGNLKSDGLGLPGRSVVLQSAAPGGSYKDTSISATTSLGGSFEFSVRPTAKTYYRVRFERSGEYAAPRSTTAVYAVPRAWVRTPIAPSLMSKSKYYTVYGYLKPRHTAGSYPVRIYKWHYVSGHWKSQGYVTAKASNYSSYTRYARSVRLLYAGKWRVRACAPADSGHATTWSSGYDYATVK